MQKGPLFLFMSNVEIKNSYNYITDFVNFYAIIGYEQQNIVIAACRP